MSQIFWIIVLVIGGCLLFAFGLHYSGEGQKIAYDLLRDQPATDEFKAQVDAEINKEMLKGFAWLMIFFPFVATLLDYFLDLGVGWLSFGFVALPLIRYRARKKIKAKYGLE